MKESWIMGHAWFTTVVTLVAIGLIGLQCREEANLPALYLAGVWLVGTFLGVISATVNRGSSRVPLALAWSLLFICTLPYALTPGYLSPHNALLASAAYAAGVGLIGPMLAGLTMLAGMLQAIGFYIYLLDIGFRHQDLDWHLAFASAFLVVLTVLGCKVLLFWLRRHDPEVPPPASPEPAEAS